MKIIIYTDGASRGNPGLASYGFVILGEDGKTLYEKGEYIGTTTNNVAEYTGALKALKQAHKMFGKKDKVDIELRADSKLVIEQLSGRFKIKSPQLKPLIEEIKILAIGLGGVIYTHVPRAQNTKADKLANSALDNK